jgi:hypothetical protein
MERTAGSLGSFIFHQIPPATRSDARSRQPSLILFSLDETAALALKTAASITAPVLNDWGPYRLLTLGAARAG